MCSSSPKIEELPPRSLPTLSQPRAQQLQNGGGVATALREDSDQRRLGVSNSCLTADAHHVKTSALLIQLICAIHIVGLPLDAVLAYCRLLHARRPPACARQGALAHCPCRERWPQAHKTASSRTPVSQECLPKSVSQECLPKRVFPRVSPRSVFPRVSCQECREDSCEHSGSWASSCFSKITHPKNLWLCLKTG